MIRSPWLPGLLCVVLIAGCKDDVAGDFRFTEVEVDGVHIEGQWFELTYLHRTDTRSIGGLVAEVDGQAITLPDVRVGPGETFLVGTAAAEASIPLDLVESFTLSDAPTLRLFDGDEVLHDVTLDGTDYPAPSPGSSLSREPEGPDGADRWCMTWEASVLDFATPGERSGPCRCRMTFDFRYRSVDDPEFDVLGTEQITLDPSGQYSLSDDVQGGEFSRGGDEDGQTITWNYSATGIVYEGTRTFGDIHFEDQPIAIPDGIEAFSSGAWSSRGDTLCLF